MLAVILALALQSRETTVCSLMRRPSSHSDALVRIRAEILLALPHGMALLDKNCPNAGMRIGFNLGNADASAKGLLSSVEDDCSPGPKRWQFPGVFVGKVAINSQGLVELRLLSVPELQTSPCPKPGVPWTVVW